jgi:hypothetical protein
MSRSVCRLLLALPPQQGSSHVITGADGLYPEDYSVAGARQKAPARLASTRSAQVITSLPDRCARPTFQEWMQGMEADGTVL